jgi:predicted glycosyltransferase involved in capsule biosynthesis
MTPKEKAKELFNKYHFSFAGVISGEEDWEFLAKQCAIIAVNLLMEEAYRQHDYEGFISYWKEVKQEIENYG